MEIILSKIKEKKTTATTGIKVCSCHNNKFVKDSKICKTKKKLQFKDSSERGQFSKKIKKMEI